MQKQFFDEKNGLWYELHGDYYLPCLTVPLEEQRPVGVWGQRHLRYLRQHRKALYTELLVSGRLNGYLADLNKQAETMFLRLIDQMAAREGITERLKAQDQMLWVRSNAVGAADEQHPGSCDGGGEQRFNLHIRSRRRGEIPAALHNFAIGQNKKTEQSEIGSKKSK